MLIKVIIDNDLNCAIFVPYYALHIRKGSMYIKQTVLRNFLVNGLLKQQEKSMAMFFLICHLQWSKEKGQTMINKTLHRKLKIE
jgi:hypothetical protein